MNGSAASGGSRVRRRYLAVPAGSFPAPTLPSAAEESAAGQLFPGPARSAGIEAPFYSPPAPPRLASTDFAGAAAEFARAPDSAPAATVTGVGPSSEASEEWTSGIFSTSEPAPEAAPVLEPIGAARPGRGTLGILVGAAVGAVIGLGLSTAMLALYAPEDFTSAIANPVALWTNVDDWKVLAGALLIVLGFAVLGAGQGAQGSSTRD